MATVAASEAEMAAEHSAEERITRLLAVLVSSGYMFYLIIMLPMIIGQARYAARVWTPVAVVLVFVPPAVFGVVAFRRRFDLMRHVGVVSALGYMVAAWTWEIAWNGEQVPSDGLWFGDVTAMTGMLAAAVWRPRWTITVLYAAELPAYLANQQSRTPDHQTPPIADALFMLSYPLLFVTAALAAMHAGRLLDQTRAAAYAAAASAADSQARNVQRQRFNALLHDWVMSTLLAASRHGINTEVSRQAGITLTKFDEIGTDDDRFDTSGLLAHLRVAINAVDPATPIHATFGDDVEESTFPGDAVRATASAASEALRNSVRHGGPDASPSVEIVVFRDGFRVVVSDRGVGFDVATVPPDRLGVAASIIGRMRALTGGAVAVRSVPGAGTTVELGWSRAA
ncbi:ATP-binding protein [Skermania sp. ID1734]|uniref:sensor histidine kinase n=1 Tax=Skermania sp. ID1734 TaxID=2597516 RepID=UPI00117D6AEF|nr:ATP-binding protein [Skermania sp. ID1734]TSE00804.1 ATP-binding protein [Skermania sp. ID1734]